MNISQDQLTLIQKTLTDSKYLTKIAYEKLYLTCLPSKDLKNRLETNFKNILKVKIFSKCEEPVTVGNILDNFIENCIYIFQNRIFDISNTNFWLEIKSWKHFLQCLPICPFK